MLRKVNNKKLRFSKIFTAEEYAKAPFVFKIIALISLSASIIVGFGSIIGLDASYRSFSEPSGIPEGVNDLLVMGVSLVEAVIGVILLSMIIAVISQAYSEQIKSVIEGKTPFKGKDHIIIVNFSEKLFYLLYVIDKKFREKKQVSDLVIMIQSNVNSDDIMRRIGLMNFKNVNITVKVGNVLDYDFMLSSGIEACSTVMVLGSKCISDRVSRDNLQVKIANTLLSEPSFRLRYRKSLESKEALNIIFEMNSDSESEKIINGMCHESKLPPFTSFNSWKFGSNIIGSSIIDNEYLNLFYEMAEHGSKRINVVKAEEGYPILVGKSFESAVTSVENGQLMGVIDGTNNLDSLNPDGKTIRSNDYLVFVEENEESTIDRKSFVESREESKDSKELILSLKRNLTERHDRRVLIIGDNTLTKDLTSWIDTDNRENIKSINNEDVSVLRDVIFEEVLEHEKYDTIVINLEEKLAFSIYMEMIYSEKYRDLGFVHKTIVVLKEQENIQAADKSKNKASVFNADALTGFYMGQLCFQPKLSKIYWELVSKEGGEFYLIDVDKEFRDNIITDYRSMQRRLIKNGINVLGCVDKEGNTRFGEIDFQHYKKAKKIIVSSKGNI